jgi:hypothetical protein
MKASLGDASRCSVGACSRQAVLLDEARQGLPSVRGRQLALNQRVVE